MGVLMLMATTNSTDAGDDEAWKQYLSQHERDSLDNLVAKLQKKSKKEMKLASDDGNKKDEDFFQKEYASKIKHVLKKYQKEAEKKEDDAQAAPQQLATSGSDAQPSDVLMLLATTNSSDAGDDEAWKQYLSQHERDSLDKMVAKLQKKSKKEMKLASKDGNKKDEDFFQKEYAAKIKKVLKKYQKEAEKKEDDAQAAPQQLATSGSDAQPSDVLML